MSNKQTSEAPQGILSFFLHAHIPYVHNLGDKSPLEEQWFFEALTECYIPLLSQLEKLKPNSKRGPYLTLSLSPPLIEMLGDSVLLKRYRKYLECIRKISKKQVGKPSLKGLHKNLAQWNYQFFDDKLSHLEDWDGDLLSVISKLHKKNIIELATTAATHAFLPLHQHQVNTIRAQIDIGIELFKKTFGFSPKGFWLPECGYFPGLEKFLEPHNIQYICLESHGVQRAQIATNGTGPKPIIKCPNGLFALGRDEECSRLIWNASEGYPGHIDYREFHRDWVDKVDKKTAEKYCRKLEIEKLPAGIKYWRITGKNSRKDWYDPQAASKRAKKDAKAFLKHISDASANASNTPQMFLIPLDAELLGHWWFEGPQWLDILMQEVGKQNKIQMSGVSASLEHFSDAPTHQPKASSWGQNGDYSFWINPEVDWIYPLIHKAAEDLATLTEQLADAPPNSLQKTRAKTSSPASSTNTSI